MMDIEALQTRIEVMEKRMNYMRMAIIVLVGFFIYDVLSADGLGAPQQIVRGTVKAQEFILLDDNEVQVGQWKGNSADAGPELSMNKALTNRSLLSAQSLSYYVGNKVNSLKKLEIDQTGIRLNASDGSLRMRLSDDNKPPSSDNSTSPIAIYNSDGILEFHAP